MSRMLAALAREGVDVAALGALFEAEGARADFAVDVLRALPLLEVEDAWRALWLLKRRALTVGLPVGNVTALVRRAEELSHWTARLTLCQLLAATGVPVALRSELFPYLLAGFADRRTIVRAWALTVALPFQEQDEFRDDVRAMLIVARRDPAASMQARLRQLRQPRRRADRPISESPR